MALLYLITHAHTHQVPRLDAARWHLSDLGQNQTAVLAQQPFWQYVDTVLVSSEPKTWLTVQPVVERLDLPVRGDARFDELRRGGWVDDYVAQVAAAFADPQMSADGWEPAASALARFQAGIAAIVPSKPDSVLALIGHGLTFSLYRAHLLGQMAVDLDDWRRLSFAAVAQVDLTSHTLVADFTPVADEMPRA